MYIQGLIPSSNYRESVSTGGETSPEKELSKDAFLRLLVAQLKHQDPLNPMESTAFTAQLAQFSSLEQLFTINDNLEILQASKNGQGLENLLDYIGKEIKSSDNNITLINGEATGGSYALQEMGDVTISIFDPEGLEVKRIYIKDQEAGEHNVNFDGRDESGYPVPDGHYSFDVQAFDKEGSPIEARTGLSGQVKSVTYQYGIPYLMIGDNIIRPETVTEVSSGATP